MHLKSSGSCKSRGVMLRVWPMFDKAIDAEDCRGYNVEPCVLNNRKLCACCEIYPIPLAAFLPCFGFTLTLPIQYLKRKLKHGSYIYADFSSSGGLWRKISKSDSLEYRKLLEIWHWDSFQLIDSLLEWAMAATLTLERDTNVTTNRTLKPLILQIRSLEEHRTWLLEGR